MLFGSNLERFNKSLLLTAMFACSGLSNELCSAETGESSAQVTVPLKIDFNSPPNISQTSKQIQTLSENFDDCGKLCLGNTTHSGFEKSSSDTWRLSVESVTDNLIGPDETKQLVQRAAAEKDEKTILDPITVIGHPPSEHSYHMPSASTATKTETLIMETPLSVTVIPKQLLKDQQVIRLGKALQNVSGVNIDISNAGLADSAIVRGFESVPFRDGFRFEDQNSNGQRDMANIERVEVLKGPGSILYGQTEPGGIINLVTKKPLKTPYQAFEQEFGSFDFYRTTLDSTGPIGSDLSYRLNFAYENAGSFRDFVEGERFFVAAVLRWDITPRLQLNLEVDYLHGQNVPDNGIPARGDQPIDVPSDRFFGEPFNKAEYDDTVVGLNWSYAINDRWTFKHRFNSEILKSNVVNVSTPFSDPTFSAGGRAVSRNLEILDGARNETYYNVIELTGKFDTWDIGHTVLFGADYYREDTRWKYVDSIPFTALNAFAPVYQRAEPPRDPSRDFPGNDIDETEDWYGLYFQDQLELSYGLHLLAGIRYDSVTASGVEFGEAFVEPRDDALTPRAGLVWRPIPELSLYGSYTENFGGPNGLALKGGLLPPEMANQWEVGVKTELWNGRFTGSLAYYDLTKQNVEVPDPLNTNFSRTIGELEVRGIELQIAGELLPGWNIFGGYAYTPFAKITNDQELLFANDGITVIGTGPGNTGRRFDDVPRHNGSLWSTYDFDQGVLRGLKLGAGIIAVSNRFADIENTAQAPGYVIANLVVGYQYKIGTSNIRLQINVDNLFDKQYFVSTSGLRFIPGSPRSVLGSIQVEF